MKTNPSPKIVPVKYATTHRAQTELKTEPPISEKDEVKKAEDRTMKAAKKP